MHRSILCGGLLFFDSTFYGGDMKISGYSNSGYQLQQTNQRKSKIFEQLSSGKRVNSAKDDPATLAIASGLESSIRELSATNRNISYQTSNLQTTSGELSASTDSLQRARELAVQASNGTLSAADRENLQAEFSQAVTAAAENSSVDLGLDEVDISTQSGAEDALAALDTAAATINSTQADLGAEQNALEYQQNANAVQAENLAAARSTAIDTDYADALSQLGREEVLAQAQLTAFKSQLDSQKNLTKTLLTKS